MTRFSTRRQGFTIIEIIVVIAIILILAAITMVGYTEMQDRINMNQKRQTTATIHNKMKKYFSLNGRYPDDPELDVMLTDENYFKPLVQSGYIGGWPCDKKTNVCIPWSWNDYQLNVSQQGSWNGSGYVLFYWDSENNYWYKEEIFFSPTEGYSDFTASSCGRTVRAIDGTCTQLSFSSIES